MARGNIRLDLYGLFGGRSGLATHCNEMAAALAAHFDLRAVVLDPAPGQQTVAGGRVAVGAADPAADVALLMAPLEHADRVTGRVRIASLAWETSRLRPRDVEILQRFDEIWTPSNWGKAVMLASGLSAPRVHVVPEGVDDRLFRPAPGPRPPGPFRFLFVGKWETRKGIEDLLTAYHRSFRADEPVELVLHAHNPFLPGFDVARELAARSLPDRPAVIASPPMPRDALARLYRSTDAFVLPTRGEGWGLPILEAMASGIAPIATACTAPLDYLTNRVGYPLRTTGTLPVDDPVFYHEGPVLGEWYQPDIDHLCHLLRHVYSQPAERAARGRRARAEVEANWTWTRAAGIARQRIELAAAK